MIDEIRQILVDNKRWKFVFNLETVQLEALVTFYTATIKRESNHPSRCLCAACEDYTAALKKVDGREKGEKAI